MSKIHYKTILLSSIFLLLTPFFVQAQLIPDPEDAIIVKISPTNPGPEELVTISINSFSVDLDNATISWFVDGVLEQQSIGDKNIQLITGGLGSSTEIDVVADTSIGSLKANQAVIRPTDVDLVWQARTSAHPLYQGKKLASVGSLIDVEVIPHFIDDIRSRLSPNELTYLWRVEGRVLQKASGRGKNTIILSQVKPLESLPVTVEVTSSDKKLFGKRSVAIPINDSELLIYENNPLLGILFNKTVRDLYSLVGQETKFIASPFFMSFDDKNDPHIDYSWELNGDSIALGEDRSSITVSNTGGEEGEADISVSVQNSRDIFQRSESTFTIEFGKDRSSLFNF